MNRRFFTFEWGSPHSCRVTVSTKTYDTVLKARNAGKRWQKGMAEEGVAVRINLLEAVKDEKRGTGRYLKSLGESF